MSTSTRDSAGAGELRDRAQQMKSAPEAASAAATRVSVLVTAICCAMVVFEGYDLISFGSVLPVLINTEAGFTPENAGLIASMVFIGSTFGALASGWLSDRYGRRVVAISSFLVFTVFTVLCGFATGPFSLGALRLLAGVGIGAIVPAASALTLEYAVGKHRTLFYTLMLSGVPVGGMLAALSGLTIIPSHGWRWVFYITVVPALILLPIIVRKLPESQVFLENAGRHEQARQVRESYGLPPLPAAVESQVAAEGRIEHEGLFSPRYRVATALFPIIAFFSLLTWFGLGTWLPGMMRQHGYDLSSALTFLLVLNIGAILGSVLIAVVTDRFGSKVTVVPTFLALGIALLLMINQWPQLPLMMLLVVAGIGGHGGQILVNRFVSLAYPPRHRAQALGWTLGAGRTGTIVGPVVIGYIVAGGHPNLGFVFFAGCALAAAVLLALVPRTPAMDLEGQ